MMQVEPTCRYCFRKMRLRHITNGHRAIVGQECQLYQYECLACQSKQLFTETGQCLEWEFTKGKYLINFWTHPIQCSIFLKAIEDGRDKCLLRLKSLPNLTPQNTSEERVKLLITFS